MATVYILYSKDIEKFYIGSCINLNQRIEEHLNKTFKGSYTTKAKHWEIFFMIPDLGYHQARKIEKHIKKMKSKKYIRDLKKFPEVVSKLIKRFPESEN